MLIHESGIPIAQVTTESAVKTFNYVKDMMPSKLDKAKILNLFTRRRYTGREFLEKYGSK